MNSRQNRPLSVLTLLLVTLTVMPMLSSSTASAQTHTISADANPCLNVRASPSYRAEIVGCIDSGSEVEVSGTDNGWSRIAAQNGLRGWAGSRYLQPAVSGDSSIRIEPAELTAYQPDTNTNDLERVSADRDELAMRLASSARRIEDLEAQLAELARQSLDAGLLQRTTIERDQALDRLRLSEELVGALESELAALRTGSESSSTTSGSLASSLEAANTERQQLARQLAQAEARQLYLQSDLEETRAELMRLKGIPPRLVQARSEPEPIAPAAELEPEPAVVDRLELPVEPDHFGADEVVQTVRAWARSWTNQRVDDYLSFYALAFEPADGQSRELWERLRRERIVRPRSISVTVEQVSPQIIGDRAQVSFVQSYTSDTFNDVVTKSMLLERVSGRWRILEERIEE